MSRSLFVIWAVVSLAWIGIVAVFAYQTWPHLPLDVSHSDPGTQSAYQQAIAMHLVKHAAMAIVPALVIGWLARFISR